MGVSMMRSRALVALVFAATLVFVLALAGCGGVGDAKGGGLSSAYDNLKAIVPGCVAYDEDTDTLTVLNFGEIEDVDKMFDAIDEAVKGRDIGCLAFARTMREDDGQAGRAAAETAERLVERIGTLPCNSMACLDISGIDAYLDDGSWTAVLPRTRSLAMEDYELQSIGDYTDEEMGNLACVKCLWLDASLDAEYMKCIGALAGLEEIRFVERTDISTAGDAASASEEAVGSPASDGAETSARNASVKAAEVSAGETVEETAKDEGGESDRDVAADATKDAESGAAGGDDAPTFDWNEGFTEELQTLQSLGSLKRILFFPGSGSWKADDAYYKFVIALQDTLPDVVTNVPGVAWDGESESLVALSAIEAVGGVENTGELEKWMAAEREDDASAYALDLGEGFEVREGLPKLDGKCLVILDAAEETGWKDSRDYKDMANYLQSIRKTLDDELEGSAVKTPERIYDFDYFVLVYPTFAQVGTYGDSTEAYATTAHVRVYDMREKARYADVNAGTAMPPDTYSYTGSPVKKYYTAIDEKAVASCLESLAQ